MKVTAVVGMKRGQSYRALSVAGGLSDMADLRYVAFSIVPTAV